ncbi:hypothetical protein HDU76_009689, partial [Blyttiomyces sp. JEL0837]
QTDLMAGFITGDADYGDYNSPQYLRTAENYYRIHREHPNSTLLNVFWLNQAGAYDCVKLMMLGIHQFMENNPQFTPEMLANGSLNHYLTPDKFAKTGYHGVIYDPIELNQYGDLQVPLMFYTLNWSMMTDDSLGFTPKTAFMMTDAAGTSCAPLSNLPIFYGGSNNPPPDGPVSSELAL